MSQYYSPNQDSELRLTKLHISLRKHDFIFYSGSGVFSIKRIDRGTMLMINNCIIENSWKVLDIGCGYGPVGIAIKKLFPDCEVTMTDVNKRAVMLSKKNSKLNKVECNIFTSDLYEKIEGKFNTILTNPPQRAGKDICFAIIEKAHDHLLEGGTLQLVARHQKGGKSLSIKMEEVFGNVDAIAKGSGFRVYTSVKR